MTVCEEAMTTARLFAVVIVSLSATITVVRAQGDSARALTLGETPRPFVDHSPISVAARAVSSRHIFKGASVNTSARDRQAIVVVHGYHGNNQRVDAIQAARAVADSSPGAFLTISVRYQDGAQYREYIVSAREITSLNAGTIKLPELASQIVEVNIGPGDNAQTHFEKYLTAAEGQIQKGNFWEAEQIVDSVSAVPGHASDRYARAMMTISQGFDAYGDLYRAAKILEKVIEQRKASGTMGGIDADLTVDRLVNLYTEDKRYKEAQALLQELIDATPASERKSNAYANNLERLAVIKLRAGDNSEAEASLKDVLSIRGTQSETNSAFARTLENLGDAHKAAGHRSEAQGMYKRAKSIYDKAVVNPKRDQQIDFQVYAGRVKQLEEKLKQL